MGTPIYTGVPMRNFLICTTMALSCFNFNVFLFKAISRKPSVEPDAPPVVVVPDAPKPPATVETKPKLSFVVPTTDMSFEAIVKQLGQWNKEAPEITELVLVGNSQTTAIPCLRIGKKTGPKVLITSAIHGDEHLCVMTTMGVIGSLLDGYMVDEETTKLLRERDIYYVPVVCPDSFMRRSRHDMGKDPNRNWTDRNCNDIPSIPSVAAMKKFFLEHKFKAAMSCHNYGKLYIYPWGFNLQPTDIEGDYRRILGKMARTSGHQPQRFDRHTSSPPYYGYEADWYHKNGAFAFVNEIGHNKEVRPGELAQAIKENLPSFKVFIDEAPMVRR
jgi:hypothetical protein